MTLAKRYVVSGRVQGVGFRFFTERVARELALSGYVKNLWDGSVEVYAVGNAGSLAALKHRLAEGPRAARVARVEESDATVDQRYTDFIIAG